MTCTCKPGIQGTMPLETSSSVYPVPCTRHPNGLPLDDEKWGEDIPWWAYLPTEDLRKVGEKKQAEIERLRRDLRDLQKKYDDMRLNYEKAHNRANEANRVLEGGDDASG